MGLQEKRAQAEIDGKVAEFSKGISDACGSCGTITIDWASYAGKNEDTIKRTEFVAVKFLIETIKEVCCDDLGKKAFNQVVQNYVIKYMVGDTKMAISGGTLTFSGEWDGACSLIGALKKQIEDQL